MNAMCRQNSSGMLKRLQSGSVKRTVGLVVIALRVLSPALAAQEESVKGQDRQVRIEKALKELKDKNPSVRAAAAEELSRLRAKEYAKEIARLLKDADAGSQASFTVTVMNALEPFGADGAAALIELLEDENPRARESAAWALQGLADRLGGGETQDVAEILITKLEDEDYAVRLNVVYALTRLGSRLEGETAKRVAHRLLAKLGDESWDVRQAAPAALVAVVLRVEEATLAACLAALFTKFTSQHEGYAQARYAAASAYGGILSRLDQGKAEPLVRSLVAKLGEGAEVRVRQAYLMALAPTIAGLKRETGEAVAKALMERLKDRELEEFVTDQYVVQPLGELVTRVQNPEPALILNMLFARLLDDKESDRIRRGAGYALRPGVPRMTNEQREKLIQLIIADPNGADVPAPTAQLLELVAPYLDGQRAREVALALLARFHDLDLGMRSSTIVALGTMAEHLELEQLDVAIARGEQTLIEDRHHFYSMEPVEHALKVLKNRKQAFGSTTPHVGQSE